MHEPAGQLGVARPAWLDAAWEKHRAWVPAVLLAHKPKWADVDDLVQEVALQVLRKGHEVREPEAFAGWLRVVAMNVARIAARKGPQNGWRGIRAVLGFGSGDGGREDVAFHDEAPASELTEHAKRVLDAACAMDDEYREPLLLKAVHGMSYREIGRVLNLPETTVETRVTRGRKKLRELLSQREALDMGLAKVLR